MSTTFFDTRLQVHHAAQSVAGFGRSLIAPRADDSHTNYAWSPKHRALLTAALDDGRRAGIRLADLTLLLLCGDEIAEELPLQGRTYEESFAFYEKHVGRMVRQPLETESLPEHAVAKGAPFQACPEDLAELDRLYAEAQEVLDHYRAGGMNRSEVRCWPHHFDIAVLETLDCGRTIGVGFVPGDCQFQDPYWYATPYPYPEDRESWAPLADGFWNREGWFGAVLTGMHPRTRVVAFLDEALTALRR